MKASDFDYHIPENLIAQHPLQERDVSRLFVLHRKSGESEHRFFKDIIDYFVPGDVLILNDTKVIPVRLRGKKPSGGKAEITLIKELSRNLWEALVKGMHEGEIILTRDITAYVSRLNGTLALVKFNLNNEYQDLDKADIKDFLNEIGVMPLPVYIKREAVQSDLGRYQTIYAKKEGAVAAPTAGLHFTDKLLDSIIDKGVRVRTITLHVGYGTFKPVTVNDIKNHRMDEERFEIPRTTASEINSAKAEGRRVFAVGTTVTRALEASAYGFSEQARYQMIPGSRKTSLFIYPGYEFRIVDALITNFHLPKSTPVMLASGFTGLALLKKSYSEAVTEGYRFFSYGDAMLIV